MSLESSIVAAFTMQGNSQSAINTYSTTDTNVTYSIGNGKRGQGAGFTGSNSWIRVADSSNFWMSSGNFGITAFVKRNVIGVRQAFLAQSNSNGNDSAISFWFEFNSANRLVCFFGHSGTSVIVLTSSNQIADTNYHHVALVRVGNTIFQYIDGFQTASASVGTLVMTNSINSVGIGVFGDGTVLALNGCMDEVYFFKGYGPTSTDVLKLATDKFYPFSRPNFFPFFQ